MTRVFALLIAGTLVLGACTFERDLDAVVQTVISQSRNIGDAVAICIENRSAEAVNTAASRLGWQESETGLVNGEFVFKATPGQICDLRYPQYLHEASIKAAVTRMRARRPKGAQIFRKTIKPGHVVHTLQQDPPNVLTFLKDGPDGKAQLLR